MVMIGKVTIHAGHVVAGAELVAGITLGIAAGSKLLRPASVSAAIRALGIRRVRYATMLLTTWEGALAGLLCFGVGSQWTLPVAVATFGSFTVIINRLRTSGFDEDCGCLGDKWPESLTLHPRIRNAALIMISAVGWALLGRSQMSDGPRAMLGGVGTVCVAGYLWSTWRHDRSLLKRWEV